MKNAEPGRAIAEAPVLSPNALAARWHVSPRTVLNLIARGALRGTQIGRQWRVTEADALAYERGRSVRCTTDTEIAS